MRALIGLVVAVSLVGACGGGGDAGGDAARPDGATADAASAVVALRVFHTNDEHGWLAPLEVDGAEYGGVANVYAHWLAAGFDPTRDLALSSGDNFTGPALSTWFEGEPAIEAMNVMGYHASALGNHEFDFGRAILGARADQAEFPYLAANVRLAGSGLPLDFTAPYEVVTIQGVAVGVIGLATLTTPSTTLPANVADLEFLDPAATLDVVVPEARAMGAEVIVVIAHACQDELLDAQARTTAVVDAWLGGHCHGPFDAGVTPPVFGTGWAWRSFSVLTIEVDRATHAVVGASHVTTPVLRGAGLPAEVTPEPELAALVARWQGLADDALGDPLGHTVTGLRRVDGWALANWIMDAWLVTFPEADVAISNFGGIRADLPTGTITRERVIDLMPFENVIVELELTGAELTAEVASAVARCPVRGSCYPMVAGMTFSIASGALVITLADGSPVDAATTYRVLVTDFVYTGGSGYTFAALDPEPTDTGVSYRQPAEDFLVGLATTDLDPLEAHIDHAPRNDE